MIGAMRMIKSPEEISVMGKAGEIAGAMMAAAEHQAGGAAEASPPDLRARRSAGGR